MASLRNRLAAWLAPERRDSSWDALGQGYGLAGMSPAGGPEDVATVLACINAIATGLSSLPATVYRATDRGREEAPGNPVARLVRAPNERQTWPDWIEWTLGEVLLHGNALSAVEVDGAGRPVALQPIPWRTVMPMLLPGGKLAFDVVATAMPWGITAAPRRFLASEVFHLKDRSDDGYLGRSRLSRAPGVLAAAIGLATYSTAIWENAATPSGMVTIPPGLKPEAIRRMVEHFESRFTGARNGKRIVFADRDSVFTPFSVSPEDAEVLESRRFGVAEICRLFQVPPPLVQDYSNNTFTNAAQADLWFARTSLQPWARKIEAEFARSVFADPSGRVHLEIDFAAMTRGDYATLWTANVAAVGAHILLADEVREAEGYGPLPAAQAPATVPPVVVPQPQQDAQAPAGGPPPVVAG